MLNRSRGRCTGHWRGRTVKKRRAARRSFSAAAGAWRRTAARWRSVPSGPPAAAFVCSRFLIGTGGGGVGCEPSSLTVPPSSAGYAAAPVTFDGVDVRKDETKKIQEASATSVTCGRYTRAPQHRSVLLRVCSTNRDASSQAQPSCRAAHRFVKPTA